MTVLSCLQTIHIGLKSEVLVPSSTNFWPRKSTKSDESWKIGRHKPVVAQPDEWIFVLDFNYDHVIILLKLK